MNKFYLIAFSLLVLLNFDDIRAQESAEISGRVFMPVMSKERRSFRGRVYRNRLSSTRPSDKKNKALKSSFIDVIVSAHSMSADSLPPALDPVTIIQVNAEFVPRVVAVTPGTLVRFINRDKFFHNVFSITPGSRFNIGRKPTGVAIGREINQLGETKIFCDIHAQMNATINCIDTQYFIRVGPDGKYRLTGLPEGTYEIQVYHPDLPLVSEIVDLKSGDSNTINFTLSR